MIARREHPEQPGIYVYVPLRMADDGTWEPLAGAEGFFHQAIDAAKMCTDAFRRKFVEIAKQARLLRALCEHPRFEFEFDGIDSEMVQESAKTLSRLIFEEVDNVARLLSEPGEEDDIVIGGATYDVDEEEEVIEPRLGERPRYRPLAGTAWEQVVAEMPESKAPYPPEVLLTAARTHLVLGEQMVMDALCSVEAFHKRVMTGGRPGEDIARAHGHGTVETGSLGSGGVLPESLGSWLTAARTYLRITEQHIVDALSSVANLRKRYERACQAAERGVDAGSEAERSDEQSSDDDE